jgi:hypothetical protein
LLKRLFQQWGYTDENDYPKNYDIISAIDAIIALKADKFENKSYF